MKAGHKPAFKELLFVVRYRLEIHYTRSTSDTTMIKFKIKIQTVYCNE